MIALVVGPDGWATCDNSTGGQTMTMVVLPTGWTTGCGLATWMDHSYMARPILKSRTVGQTTVADHSLNWSDQWPRLKVGWNHGPRTTLG